MKPPRYDHFIRALSIAIREGREREKLTQEDVAHLARLSVRHYQKLEAGDSANPKLENLHSIAAALDMRLSDLIAEAER